MTTKDEMKKKAYGALINLEEQKAIDTVKLWIDKGNDPVDMLNALQDAMIEVGKKYETMEYYLPQVMMAAEIMDSTGKLISEKLAASGIKTKVVGTVVIGTIEGDIHDLGKNIVAGMMKTSGFKVVDLGRDVPVATMVKTAKEQEANIIGGSSLMTTSMPYLGDVVRLLEDTGVRDKFKVMIGGAPVSAAYAEKIRADAYAKNANEAVAVALELIKK